MELSQIEAKMQEHQRKANESKFQSFQKMNTIKLEREKELADISSRLKASKQLFAEADSRIMSQLVSRDQAELERDQALKRKRREMVRQVQEENLRLNRIKRLQAQQDFQERKDGSEMEKKYLNDQIEAHHRKRVEWLNKTQQRQNQIDKMATSFKPG